MGWRLRQGFSSLSSADPLSPFCCPRPQSAFGQQVLVAEEADEVSVGVDVSQHTAGYLYAGAAPLTRERTLGDAGDGGGAGGSPSECSNRLSKFKEPFETRLNPIGILTEPIGTPLKCFSTHGHLSAAKGSSSTVSRSDIRLISTF